jgi:hypothetical protein
MRVVEGKTVKINLEPAATTCQHGTLACGSCRFKVIFNGLTFYDSHPNGINTIPVAVTTIFVLLMMGVSAPETC